MTQPIKPSEIAERKQHQLPDGVIEAFNDLIVRKFDGRSATVRQDDVVEEILHRTLLSREEIFTFHYLDVEEVFRRAGWKVTFDKPGYNETYPATFKFEK